MGIGDPIDTSVLEEDEEARRAPGQGGEERKAGARVREEEGGAREEEADALGKEGRGRRLGVPTPRGSQEPWERRKGTDGAKRGDREPRSARRRERSEARKLRRGSGRSRRSEAAELQKNAVRRGESG